jgi:hypothetical protein
MRALRNDRAWRQVEADLTRFAGRDVVLYFNAFNEGDGQRTWMFVDDVSVQACP